MVPSLTLEEVAPIAFSDAQSLAPEEIYNKPKKEVKGETEITSEEKKRLRKEKKKKKQKEKKEKEADFKLVQKLNPGFGNKYSKQKALEKLKSSRVSKQFSFLVFSFYIFSK